MSARSRDRCRLPRGSGWCLSPGGWVCLLGLWWAGLCAVACLEVAVGSGRLQPACLLMVGTVSLPGCLAWGVPALVPISSFVGPGLGAMEPAEQLPEVFTHRALPTMSATSIYVHRWATAGPHLSSTRSTTSRWSGPSSYQITALTLGPSVYEILCVLSNLCSVAESCPTLSNPWTSACQASLSITNSWSLLKLMYIESVMPFIR